MNKDAMKPASLSRSLLGRTIRWTFSDGPVKGQTFEHTFNDDGSVTWRATGGQGAAQLTRESASGVAPVNDQIALVSYLAANGFTLTVALDFEAMRMIGIASNEKTWVMQKGSFELLPEPA